MGNTRGRTPARTGSRYQGTRAATLVEYALVVAMLVLGLSGVIQMLENETEAEVANEFDCVSERPPPPTCQRRAVVVTTTTEVLPTTSSTLPDEEPTTTTTEVEVPEPTTTTTTTEPTSPATSASWGDLERGVGSWGIRYAAGTLTIVDATGQPVVGREVTVIAINGAGEAVGWGSCTSDASGRCAVVVLMWTDSNVRLQVRTIAGEPPLDPPTETSGWLSG